jgi:hypothetical protein
MQIVFELLVRLVIELLLWFAWRALTDPRIDTAPAPVQRPRGPRPDPLSAFGQAA